VLDQPITLMTPEGEWRPENYDKVFNGPITIRKLGEVGESVAIQVLKQGRAADCDRVCATHGTQTLNEPVPALAIGAREGHSHGADHLRIRSFRTTDPGHTVLHRQDSLTRTDVF
jgi:membrane carboxypeptidase/penicillin-binding protein